MVHLLSRTYQHYAKNVTIIVNKVVHLFTQTSLSPPKVSTKWIKCIEVTKWTKVKQMHRNGPKWIEWTKINRNATLI